VEIGIPEYYEDMPRKHDGVKSKKALLWVIIENQVPSLITILS